MGATVTGLLVIFIIHGIPFFVNPEIKSTHFFKNLKLFLLYERLPYCKYQNNGAHTDFGKILLIIMYRIVHFAN